MTSLAADHAACTEALRRSGSSFSLPIRLLPPAKRRGTTALYAFCRRADDIVDDAPDPGLALAELRRFERELGVSLQGQPVGDPVVRAVTDTVRRFGVPQGCLFDVIDGVRMDLEHRGFGTYQELQEYCRRVASAVGIAAIHIWGHHGAAALPAAHACGLAFQLTNILRDVAEDRERGRLYLARDDLAACGCPIDDALAGRGCPGAAAVVRLYCERTAVLFREAARLDHMLTTDGRLVFRAMFAAYRAIFAAVQDAGAMILTRRVRPHRAKVIAAMVTGVVLGPQP